MSVVLTWPQVEFDRAWALGLGGFLKFSYLNFTAPRYNTGLVVSVSFSNRRKEETPLQQIMRRLDRPPGGGPAA